MTALSKLHRFILILIIPLLISAVCLLLVWIVPGDYNHDLAVLVNKRDLLISSKPPRIIYIGGSSLITLNSGHIEKLINIKWNAAYSVVNMGLWGGLDMARYLDEIKTYCLPGDIIIISQEYATMLNPGYFKFITRNEEANKFFFLMRPGSVFRQGCTVSTLREALTDLILLDQLKIKTYLLTAINGRIDSATGGYYRYREQYTAHGDRRSPFKIVRPLREKGAGFQEPDMRNLLYLKKFHEYARARGIRVFFSFPPFPAGEYRLNKIHIDSLARIIRDGLGLDILTMPDATIYPESCFADTVNHLQPHCEKKRTRVLLEQLSLRHELLNSGQ